MKVSKPIYLTKLTACEIALRVKASLPNHSLENIENELRKISNKMSKGAFDLTKATSLQEMLFKKIKHFQKLAFKTTQIRLLEVQTINCLLKGIVMICSKCNRKQREPSKGKVNKWALSN